MRREAPPPRVSPASVTLTMYSGWGGTARGDRGASVASLACAWIAVASWHHRLRPPRVHAVEPSLGQPGRPRIFCARRPPIELATASPSRVRDIPRPRLVRGKGVTNPPYTLKAVPSQALVPQRVVDLRGRVLFHDNHRQLREKPAIAPDEEGLYAPLTIEQ
eukprot:scaffold144275_cov142-Phaeocystis_antarctica.AAC.2